MKKYSLDELLSHEKCHSCFNHKKSSNTGFKSVQLEQGDMIAQENSTFNNVMMVLSGTVSVACNTFHDRYIYADSMVMLPRGSTISITALNNTEFMFFGFDTLLNNCDKMRQEIQRYAADSIQYNFQSIPIKKQLHAFIGLLKCYMAQHVNCYHLLKCKHYEFFILLNAFYTRQEAATLLYPILGRNMTFHSFIIENYRSTRNVSELISLSGMGKTQFYDAFKKEFGMTAKQWLLQHRVHKLYTAAMDSTLSIKDIMYASDFDNASVFYRFCQQHFGKSPEEVVASLRKKPL